MPKQASVKELQDRQYKIKYISKGIALIIVGGIIITFSGIWAIIIGTVLVLAGIGMIAQGFKIKVEHQDETK